MSLELLSPLYNFRGHLNTQSFGNTLDITLEPNNILYLSDYQIIHSILVVI